MRTRTAGWLVVLGVLAGAGCSSGDGLTELDDLRVNPTLEGCQDALRTFVERVRVPTGHDATDGVDEAERTVAQSVIDTAARGLYNPQETGHPCNEALATMSEAENVEFFASLDPEVMAFIFSINSGIFVPTDPTGQTDASLPIDSTVPPG